MTGPAQHQHAGRVVPTFVVAAAVLAACGPSRATEPDARYVAVHNALAATGLTQVGPIQRGSLAEGREARVPLELPAQCTTVVALGGAGVRDLRVALLDVDDKPVAHDTTRDREAAVRTCPEKAGRYTAVVGMAEGAGDWLIATWSGGPAGAGGPAGPQSPAAAVAAGTCESPIVLVPGTTLGNTRRGEAEHAGTCGNSASSEVVYHLEVPRRQRVTLEVDPQFDSVLYVRRDACDDEDAEVACNDDASKKDRTSSARGSRVDEVLDPGAYFVFVDGYGTEAGGFRLTTTLSDVPTLADACRSARAIGAQKVTGQLGAAFDNTRAACGSDAKGPDVLYQLAVTQRVRMRATTSSGDFSPVTHVRRTCTDESSELACASSGWAAEDATVVGWLDPGAYTLVADSSEQDARGSYSLEVETAPENGSGVPADACPDAARLGTSEKRIEGDTFRARDDVSGRCAGQGAPDVLYRFELARRSRVTARFLTQEGSHVFVLAKTCGDAATELACTANLDETLPAGVYSLAVDGSAHEGFGRFAFAFDARDVAAQESACKSTRPLSPGQKVSDTTTSAGDRFRTSCGGREDMQASSDRVYRIVVTERSRVQLQLSSPAFDGVVALRKTCLDPPQMRSAKTAEVACNNDAGDNRHSRVDAVVEPGTYWVVVDGNGAKNEGAFTLEYKLVKL